MASCSVHELHHVEYQHHTSMEGDMKVDVKIQEERQLERKGHREKSSESGKSWKMSELQKLHLPRPQ